MISYASLLNSLMTPSLPLSLSLSLSPSSSLHTMHQHCTALTSLVSLPLLFLFSFLALISSLYSILFSLLSSSTVTGKNISFLAASASRAAIHKTFAVHENLADITAKTGSQCILGRLPPSLSSFPPSLLSHHYFFMCM